MKKLISLVALVLTLTLVANSFAEEAKEFKIGALTKSLANPYFLSMKEGYDYAQKKLEIELVFGSTPREEADVEQLNILQSWLAEGS
jgi:ABC-type sugar transport system substrate-binding protein